MPIAYDSQFDKDRKDSNPQGADQFSSFNNTSHEHNGIDSPRVNQKNIILSSKFVAFFEVTPGGTSSIITLSGVSNPNSITFMGIAANNLGGGTATEKATITGNAQFGPCYLAQTLNFGQAASNPITVVQANTGIYIHTTTLTDSQVFADNINFINVIKPDGTSPVKGTITSWSNNEINMTFTVIAGWYILGSLIIT